MKRLCAECGLPDNDYYMVHDALWDQYGAGEGFLHRACLAKRMGRNITSKDLTDAPINAPAEEVLQMRALRVGDIVRALRNLDPDGAHVHKGDLGVVFAPDNYYSDGNGPMVRWFCVQGHQVGLGGACNVYTGDVVKLSKATAT